MPRELKVGLGPAKRALQRLCGAIGAAGCGSFVVGDATAAVLRPAYDPVSQTMSDLAMGHRAWIQESAMWVFAAGSLAAAVGLTLARADWAWRLRCLPLYLLAAASVLVALHPLTPQGAPTAHIWAAGGVVVATALAALGLAPLLRPVAPTVARLSTAIGLGLAILGPLFLLVPDNWQGAAERALAGLGLTWVAMISGLLSAGRIGAQRGAAAGGSRSRPPGARV